jgi:hypothetical protein
MSNIFQRMCCVSLSILFATASRPARAAELKFGSIRSSGNRADDDLQEQSGGVFVYPREKVHSRRLCQ